MTVKRRSGACAWTGAALVLTAALELLAMPHRAAAENGPAAVTARPLRTTTSGADRHERRGALASAPAVQTHVQSGAPAPGTLSAVRALLETGAERGAKALESARAHYARLKQQSRAHTRADYAFALVLIEHHKYDEATELLANVAADSRGLTKALATQLRIWALLARQRYEDALDEIAAVADVYPRDEPKDHPELWREAAERLGALLGFAESAARTALSSGDIARYARQTELRLPSYALAGFDEGRVRTVRQFAELEQDYQLSALEAADQLSEKRSEDKQQLADAKADIEQRCADLAARLQVEAERIEKNLADVDQKIREVNLALVALPRTLNALVNQRPQVQRQFLNRAAVQPIGRDAAQSELLMSRINTNGLDSRTSNVDSQLAAIEVERAGLQTRLRLLLRQRSDLLLAHERTTARLADKREALEAQQRRLAGKSEHPPPATVPRSHATGLATRLRSVATYVELLYEHEAQRVLESYEGEHRMTKSE